METPAEAVGSRRGVAVALALGGEGVGVMVERPGGVEGDTVAVPPPTPPAPSLEGEEEPEGVEATRREVLGSTEAE